MDLPDLEYAYLDSTVPALLSNLFSNQIHMNLGEDTNTLVVDLFIIYADLLEKVPEYTAQVALQLGSPSYFHQVLAYGNRPNLLTQGEQHV